MKFIENIKIKSTRLILQLGLVVLILFPSESYSQVCSDLLQALPQEGTVPGDADYTGDVTSIRFSNCDAHASFEDDRYPNIDGSAKSCDEMSCEGILNCAGNTVTPRGGSGTDPFTVTFQFKRGPGDLSLDRTVTRTLALDGTTTISVSGLIPIDFVLEQEGDLACLYATSLAIPACGFGGAVGVAVKGSVVIEGNKTGDSSVLGTNTDGLTNPIDPAIPWNCVPIPLPIPPVYDLDWGGLISDVCLHYDNSVTNFRHPAATPPYPSRAFTGVVMQCIEETMNNIFTHEIVPGDPNSTFYSQMKATLISAITNLLILYIIIFGYPYVIGKKGLAQEQWHWFALRFAFVWYFAAGTGMADWLPSLQDTSKSLALVVLEAVSGNPADAALAATQLEAASGNLATANNDLAQARRDYSNTPSAGNFAAVTTRTNARDTALDTYNDLKMTADSYGYNYCDFRSFVTTYPTEDYPVGMETYRLWDTIDCKVSKFLGIGDNRNAPRSPHLLTLTAASIVTNIGIGFLNFILVVILTIFILLVIIRVVHIYMMASIGLVLLAYIAPLIVPTILFQYTRYIFDAWLRQIIAYVVQPVLLFAFLAFMISAMDMAMFGGNHHFVPMSWPPGEYDNKLCMTYVGSGQSSNNGLCENLHFMDAFENKNVKRSALTCDDPSAMGCVIQKAGIKKERNNHLGLGVNRYTSTISFKGAKDLFIGLLQMLLVSYLAHAVLGLVEKMSASLTNAAGGGGSGLSSAPTASPHAIGGTVLATTSAAFGATVGKSMAARSRKKAARNAVKESQKSKAKDDAKKEDSKDDDEK